MNGRPEFDRLEWYSTEEINSMLDEWSKYYDFIDRGIEVHRPSAPAGNFSWEELFKEAQRRDALTD